MREAVQQPPRLLFGLHDPFVPPVHGGQLADALGADLNMYPQAHWSGEHTTAQGTHIPACTSEPPIAEWTQAAAARMGVSTDSPQAAQAREAELDRRLQRLPGKEVIVATWGVIERSRRPVEAREDQGA